MMEFDDFSDKKSDTDLIMEKREKIIEKMEKKLKKLNFNEAEIQDVVKIINITQNRIEQLKTVLVGTNVNTDDPSPIMNHIITEIRILQTKMSIDIKKQIAETLKAKMNNN